jgi:hypothetical protein
MNEYRLSPGAHETPDEGRCVMEWAAWIAGEPHSDQPVCVDSGRRRVPAVMERCARRRDAPAAAAVRGPRDRDRDDGRSLERSFMCFDWLVRVHTPAWLELAGLAGHANALRGLPPIIDREGVRRADPLVNAAGAAAWAAARDTARAAVRDAAGAAARDAAGAARDAAGAAAWAAARDAAGDAARDAAAAWAAVRDAAWAAAGAAAGAPRTSRWRRR